MHTIEKALKPGSPYFSSVTELERATKFLAHELGELEELLVEASEEVGCDGDGDGVSNIGIFMMIIYMELSG